MSNEKCKECKRILVLDEENVCAYCELTQEKREEKPFDVNCGICKVIVEDDSEGLFCDVCKTWFHNECNETPLNYELYALLNEAPHNVKWFCDKCIWETEKWIKEVHSKRYQTLENKRDTNTINKKTNRESKKRNGEVNEVINILINEECNEVVHEDDNEENEDDNTEANMVCSPAIPEIKLEVDNENENVENGDSDEWVPTEEKEEVVKIKQKKKRKNKSSEKLAFDNDCPIFDNIMTENISNILDISPDDLSNITDGIVSVKKLKHMRSKCNLCPKAFLHIEDCIAHKLRDHTGVQKPFKCSVCQSTFETKKLWKRHMTKHSSEVKFSCNICAKTLKSNDSLRSHQKIFHSDEKFSCTECDFTSKYKTVLKQHMINKHSSETQYQCNICNKSFVSDCFLKYHMAVHSSDKPFACEVCNKRFTTGKQRKKHMLRHATEKPFECTECDKKYATKELLTKHMPSHIPNAERPFACDQCISRFNSISNLRKHQEIHTGAMKVICDICGKGFRDPHYLKRHTMMHTDERPLKCEICGKGFRHSGHLDLHIKYHKKIINAHCPICGFGAPTRYVLNTHIKLVHTNETPFECDMCGNKYKTKGNLSKHKRGIRGSCKGFNTSDSLIHEKKVSKSSYGAYYEQDESKLQNVSIPIHEPIIATARLPTVTNHDIHPSVLLYANSHNSNSYATQYHSSLIPSNGRGITATVQTSPISY